MARRAVLAVFVAGAVACSGSSKDSPQTTCGTHTPVASASATPAAVAPGTSVQLTATSTDEDDACLAAPESRTYRWRVEARPPTSAAVVSDPGSPAPTLTPDVPGEYQLEVVATDAAGHASAPAFVTISASACNLLAPTVSLASPLAGALFNPVTLPAPSVADANCVASGSVGYTWTLVSRPAGSSAILSDPSARQPVLVPDVVGPYQVALVVTSSVGIASAPAFAVVDVSTCGSAAPVLPALTASPAAPNAGDLVTLGLAAAIVDANETGCGAAVQPYRYRWTLVSTPLGSSAVLTSDSAAAPSFVADVPDAVYQIALTVTDALGNESAPAFLQVGTSRCGVNPPLVALQPTSPAGDANTPIALSALAVDADNSSCPAAFATAVAGISWSVVGQPPGSHPALALSFTVPTSNGLSPPTFTSPNAIQADVPGQYVVQAVATDARGVQGAPVQTSVLVSACGAHAPTVTRLTVTDSSGAVVSRPAVGQPVRIAATLLDLDASVATCPVADVAAMSGASFVWTLASAPAGSAVPLSVGPQSSAAIAFTPDVAGTYVWRVVATDPQGLASEPATVTVPTGDCGPVIAATPAIVASSPAPGAGATVTLGLGAPPTSACVAGGAAPTLAWSLVRPAGSSAVLSAPSGAAPTFTADVPGPYAIQLVVTDSGGFSSVFGTTVVAGGCAPPLILNTGAQPLLSTDLVTAVIEPDGSSASVTAPVNAGARVSLALPLATASRGGLVTGSCGGGSPEWSIISRPAGSQAQLSSTTAPTPAFVPDVPNGTWQLAVLVRDGQGNPSQPYFFSVSTSACGALAPSLGPAISFSPAPHANAPFTAAAPAAVDGNAACPVRFRASGFTYAFALVGGPAGASAQLVPGAGGTASITASQGGVYSVQVIATASTGLSSAPVVTAVPVSACGAYPPVAASFGLSQAVPAVAGGTVPLSEAAATSATLTAGGAATSTRGWYVDVPLVVSATVADADFGGACSGFGVPAQGWTSSWALQSAPLGSHATVAAGPGATALLTPDLPGSYTLALTTTDSTGNGSTSVVTLAAPCGASAPIVAAMSGSQAGPSGTLVSTQSAPVPLAVAAPIALGAVALDADTSVTGTCSVAEAQPLAYQWSFAQLPPGSAATLSGASTAAPSFVPDVAGPYGLALTVTDPQGHAASSRLDVSVTCDAAAPAVAVVSGTAAVPDFTVAQVVGGIAVAGQPGTHTLRLTRGSAPSNDLASVDGAPGVATPVALYPGFPVAVAANVPSTQTSAGCGLYAQTVTYAWTLIGQPAGSAAQLVGASGPSPSFVPDLPGSYALQLLLTDQLGRSSRTTLALDALGATVASVGTCGRRAPLASARVLGPVPSPASGTPVEPVGALVQVDASTSQPADATPFATNGSGGCGLPQALTYAWSLVSVPTGSTAALTATSLVDPSISVDRAGLYQLRVAVSDGTNVATASLPLMGSAAATSTPATTGQVFTATAMNGSGNPVVAWWDNSNGSVGAARCTAGCATATPTWASLGAIDSGLVPLTFAAADEPRPIAVAVSGTNTYVAYFTSGGGAGTAGAHALAACTVALAIHDGTSWSWRTVPTGAPGTFNACTPGGAPPYTNYEFGRWLSLAMGGTGPVIAYWSVVDTSTTQVEYTACTSATCAGFTPGTVEAAAPGALLGRWNSLVVDASGALDAAYYVENDGSGNRGLRFATNASGSFTASWADSGAGSDVGRFASLATVPATPPSGPPTGGPLALAYADSTARVGKVVLFTRQGPAWIAGTPATIPDSATTDAGHGVVVASDPATGALELAYHDGVNGVVRIFRSSDRQTFSAVDDVAAPSGASGPVGLSIAVGTDVGIGYSRSDTGPLGFATLAP